MHVPRFVSPAITACLLLPLLALPRALSQPIAQGPPSSTMPQRSPRDWALLASNCELTALTHDSSWFRYRTHVIDSKGDRVRDVVESKDGTVARTLYQGGKPLSAEADKEERQRLTDLASSPSEFARHVKNDVSGKKLAADLIRLMPDAMIYTPVPGQENARSASGSRLVVLDFSPNPKWNPPTTASEALTGLHGRVWIDSREGYVTRLDGEIFRPVNIGWGMVAHVFPGGKVSLEQVKIAPNRWMYSHFVDQARVRALMFKTIDISAEITTSNYQPLPGPISYQDAISLLLR